MKSKEKGPAGLQVETGFIKQTHVRRSHRPRRKGSRLPGKGKGTQRQNGRLVVMKTEKIKPRSIWPTW